MSEVMRATARLVRAAKAGEVSTDAALLDIAGLDRDELLGVMCLLFPVLCELYASKAAGAKLLDTLDEQTFAELSAQIDIDERAVLADVDPIGSVWKESDEVGSWEEKLRGET